MKISHVLALLLLATACSNNKKNIDSPAEDEMPRVNTAAKGGNTAAYFIYVNELSEPDTLLAVSSTTAELTQVHESYPAGDGMMGMREIKHPTLAAGQALHFETGGLHIMLMNLKTDLAAGDSVKIVMNWAVAGDVPVVLPVKPHGGDNHAAHAH